MEENKKRYKVTITEIGKVGSIIFESDEVHYKGYWRGDKSFSVIGYNSPKVSVVERKMEAIKDWDKKLKKFRKNPVILKSHRQIIGRDGCGDKIRRGFGGIKSVEIGK